MVMEKEIGIMVGYEELFEQAGRRRTSEHHLGTRKNSQEPAVHSAGY